MLFGQRVHHELELLGLDKQGGTDEWHEEGALVSSTRVPQRKKPINMYLTRLVNGYRSTPFSCLGASVGHLVSP